MPEATGTPRFLCDAMLGRLARWLRLLGYDTRYADLPDDALVALARAAGRVLLTRDTRLVRRPDVGPHGFIRHDRVAEQLRQVTADFRLGPARGGTRCPACARIYWPGTHWDRMTQQLAGLRAESQPVPSVLSPQSSPPEGACA